MSTIFILFGIVFILFFSLIIYLIGSITYDCILENSLTNKEFQQKYKYQPSNNKCINCSTCKWCIPDSNTNTLRCCNIRVMNYSGEAWGINAFGGFDTTVTNVCNEFSKKTNKAHYDNQ